MQLSDRPASQPPLDLTAVQRPIEVEEPLSWSEVDPSGTAYDDDDGIWENVDFGAESSEDDISSVSSEAPAPRVLPKDSIALEEDYVIPDELFSSGEDEDLIASIKSVQFWKGENNQALTHKVGSHTRPITELQIVRETIFMLQGFPTSLFWRIDGSIEVDRRYALEHSSNEALSSLLRSFSLIGAQIDTLRKFTKTPQTIAYVQSFLRGVEGLLHKFDSFLSNAQAHYLSQTSTVAISFIQLLDDVQRESRLLLSLTDLVSSFNHDIPGQSMRCLDLLYDLVCMLQAVGDDNGFRTLAELFFSCFESYMRPIQLWMETGRLDSVGGTFFILENRKDNDLRALWRDWYTLDESRLQNVPKFVQPVAHRTFTTGKSMVFLRHLNAIPPDTESLEKRKLTFEDIYPRDSSASLSLPFSVKMESAFEKLIKANHTIASDLLQTALDQQCGLWMSLQALEYIYLCKDVSISGTIDHKIFESIDRGRGAWNDRFLLTELAQGAFSTVQPLIDPSRLIVRSAKVSDKDPNVQNRSVKILKALSFDYILPWPVANIITKDAIQTYQRISTFLMQIRRAQYVTVKQRLQYNNHTERGSAKGDSTLAYALRHNMLWFLNVLYGHITDLVITTTTNSMRKDLSASKDLDTMIAVHRSYMSSMEDRCLLSRNLVPLHEAIINLLDLCVRFADLQAMLHNGQNQFDQTKTITRNGPFNRRDQRTYDEDDDDDDDDDENDAELQGNTPPAHDSPSSYPHQLRALKDQFDRLVAFVTAGLKSVGRVDGQPSWEILAEKLEWRKERPAW